MKLDYSEPMNIMLQMGKFLLMVGIGFIPVACAIILFGQEGWHFKILGVLSSCVALYWMLLSFQIEQGGSR